MVKEVGVEDTAESLSLQKDKLKKQSIGIKKTTE